MSCPEIVDLFEAMKIDTRGKLDLFERNLQSKFGDPRVYESQRVEQHRMEARTLHSKSRESSKLLEDAYTRQMQKNRETHAKRMLKFRNYPASASRPESRAASSSEIRTPAPPEQLPSEQIQTGPAQSLSS